MSNSNSFCELSGLFRLQGGLLQISWRTKKTCRFLHRNADQMSPVFAPVSVPSRTLKREKNLGIWNDQMSDRPKSRWSNSVVTTKNLVNLSKSKWKQSIETKSSLRNILVSYQKYLKLCKGKRKLEASQRAFSMFSKVLCRIRSELEKIDFLKGIRLAVNCLPELYSMLN